MSRDSGSSRTTSAELKVSAAAAEADARALPIPTYCEPWPGKTNAYWATDTDRISGLPPARRFTCNDAWMRDESRDDDDDLSPAVAAARDQIQNPRLLSDRIAMGRALWRDL